MALDSRQLPCGAGYVDRLLKGAGRGPARGTAVRRTVINLKTAKALGSRFREAAPGAAAVAAIRRGSALGALGRLALGARC